MSDGEKEANRHLANSLFDNVLGGNIGLCVDLGAKFPFLSHCLQKRGCDALAVDAIDTAPHFGEVLGVRMLRCDFEDDWQWIIKEVGPRPVKLFTMVHAFEHVYNPRRLLLRMRDLLAPDGRIFIRMPDHGVPGYERDMRASHYLIHPWFYAIGSILEMCAQLGDVFEVERADEVQPGQRDITLRPLARRPRLSVAIICKNEQRDIGKAIASVKPIADTFVVCDTGSTDNTMAATLDACSDARLMWSEYTGASERDDAGDWKLWDFAKARNHALEIAETTGDEWVMWIDADDIVRTPRAFKRAMYWPQFGSFGAWIVAGGHRWVHYRMWKRSAHVRFKGRCHEYPVLDDVPGTVIMESAITHDAEPTIGETGNDRNLRMLMREWDESATTRGAFYIGCTHRDAGRWDEAAHWFRARITLGEGYRDEWLFAHLYLARALRQLKRADEAEVVLCSGLALAPDWQEFRMELAQMHYAAKRYDVAIAHAELALNQPIPETHLWREHGQYRDQPARLISWCHDHAGALQRSLEFAKLAQSLIGGPDHEWNVRIIGLEQRIAAPDEPQPGGAEAVKWSKALNASRPIIGLCRPGAIGDILMTLNLIPALREANPGHDIYYFCAPQYAAQDSLGWIIQAAGCDAVMSSDHWEQWRGKFARAVSLVGYPLAEGYPDKPMQRHLLEYFADEMGVFPVDLQRNVFAPASLTLPLPYIEDTVPYATLQVTAGWSAYKQWPFDKWAQVVAALPDIRFIQIGERDAPRIPGTWNFMLGTSLQYSIAEVANARLHVGIDSFANHLTNYYWQSGNHTKRTPGVILWGSTQASAAGYPGNTNISKGLHCQPCFKEDETISRHPRGICKNPPYDVGPGSETGLRFYGDGLHACMAAITVDEVVEAIREKWGSAT
jgi:ADP-heptose:LPS heptosyltransferase